MTTLKIKKKLDRTKQCGKEEYAPGIIHVCRLWLNHKDNHVCKCGQQWKPGQRM
jgi:hypothetical protein